MFKVDVELFEEGSQRSLHPLIFFRGKFEHFNEQLLEVPEKMVLLVVRLSFESCLKILKYMLFYLLQGFIENKTIVSQKLTIKNLHLDNQKRIIDLP